MAGPIIAPLSSSQALPDPASRTVPSRARYAISPASVETCRYAPSELQSIRSTLPSHRSPFISLQPPPPSCAPLRRWLSASILTPARVSPRLEESPPIATADPSGAKLTAVMADSPLEWNSAIRDRFAASRIHTRPLSDPTATSSPSPVTVKSASEADTNSQCVKAVGRKLPEKQQHKRPTSSFRSMPLRSLPISHTRTCPSSPAVTYFSSLG
eukprot:1181098-Rhodomonas_salina.2